MACLPLSDILEAVAASDTQPIQTFLDEIGNGFEQMRDQLELATSDLAYKIATAEAFLAKAECFGFLKGLKNPVINSLFEEVGLLKEQVGQLNAVRNKILNLIENGIVEIIGEVIQIVGGQVTAAIIEQVGNLLGGVLDEVQEAIAAVKVVEGIVGSTKKGLGIAASTISCITGEALPEDLANQLQEINDQIDALDGILEDTGIALGIFESILTGEFCIDFLN